MFPGPPVVSPDQRVSTHSPNPYVYRSQPIESCHVICQPCSQNRARSELNARFMPEACLAMAVAMAEEEAQEEKGIAPAPAPRIDAALPLQDFDWKLKVCLGSEIFIIVMWFVFYLVLQFECSCEAGLRSVRGNS